MRIYVSKVRREEANTVYCIAGDMFRGSVIDSEFRGISTIEIMNMLAPDVVTIGNHEIDYGIAHLLFLEKCAKFPIINANLHITTNHARLFKSHYVMEVDGMKILFIGILTDTVLAMARKEALVGGYVDVCDAVAEVERICNAYNSLDIDCTVLLTHIGFEEDKQLAARLDYLMLTYGAEKPSFDTIIASGANGSKPHAVPSDKPVEAGDFITLDFGAMKDGYCSDTTRTVAVGSVTDEMRAVYDTVLQAQLAGIAVARAGVTGRQVDAAARDFIAAAGYGEYFGHGFGHGLGIEVHEAPTAAPSYDRPLPAGAVISAEPGIYLPGKLGVRIEDVIILTEDGNRNITGLTKELLIL